MTLKELPYQDGINWTELEGKPAIFNWDGKPMAGTLYLVWPDNTTHVNVKCVTDFHVFEFFKD